MNKCEQTLLFIAMYYCEYMSLEVKGQHNSSILSASLSLQSSNQGLPVLHLSWSALQRVSSGYAEPPSPAASIPCCIVQHWCLLPLDQVVVLPCRDDLILHHPLFKLIPVFLQFCLQSHLYAAFAWSHRPSHSCRIFNIPHWIPKGSVSLTLINIDESAQIQRPF